MIRVIILLLFSLNAGASEFKMVVPIVTGHAVYDDTEDYNNNVYGLGVEYVTSGRGVFGTTYLKVDSRHNENLFLYGGYNFKNNITAGGFIAFNYETPIMSPFFAYTVYDHIRLVTTFPAGLILGGPVDIFNIQLIF